MNYCLSCPDSIRGLCCYYSVIIRKGKIIYNIILPNHPCPFLDLDTKLCTIYEERFEINPYCESIKDAIKHNGLPKGCKYLKETNKKTIPRQPFEPKKLPNDIRRYVVMMNNRSQQEIIKQYRPKLLKYIFK